MKPLSLPHFIIAGAPRSGTTWLYELLDKHPEIYMAKPVKPEPKFFLRDDLYHQGLEYYSKQWFEQAPPCKQLGEKTTNYLESPNAAQRIAESLPDVKLIFILREPCDRAFSNYLWSRMNGLEDLDFETAIEIESERERTLSEKLRYARPYSYFSRGLYVDMLAPFFERFTRQQILCLRFEDIQANPENLTLRLHQFIGVTPRALDFQNLGVINPAARVDIEFPTDVRARLMERFSSPNQQLGRL